MKELFNTLSNVSKFFNEKRFIFQQNAPSATPPPAPKEKPKEPGKPAIKPDASDRAVAEARDAVFNSEKSMLKERFKNIKDNPLKNIKEYIKIIQEYTDSFMRRGGLTKEKASQNVWRLNRSIEEAERKKADRINELYPQPGAAEELLIQAKALLPGKDIYDVRYERSREQLAYAEKNDPRTRVLTNTINANKKIVKELESMIDVDGHLAHLSYVAEAQPQSLKEVLERTRSRAWVKKVERELA